MGLYMEGLNFGCYWFVGIWVGLSICIVRNMAKNLGHFPGTILEKAGTVPDITGTSPDNASTSLDNIFFTWSCSRHQIALSGT